MNKLSKDIIRAIIIVVCLSISLIADAKEIKIKSFSMLMEPMTVPMQRKDNNGNVCALVKVIIPSAHASFEGSIIGNCDFKISEYWCYLSPGSKQLKIKYPNCDPIMVYFDQLIGSGVKSKQIYELSLDVPVSSIEQNQKIYTLSLTVHSNKQVSILGKQTYVHMDSVSVKRFNKNGVYISTTDFSKGALAAISGEYEFQIGAIEGDILEVSAKGYTSKKIKFNNPNNDCYNITLEPQCKNVKFQLRDSNTKEVLIGANTYKNPYSNSSLYSTDWDNRGDLTTKKQKSEEASYTDIDGETGIFKNVKMTDKFLFTYAGYKKICSELSKLYDIAVVSNENVIIIELAPYKDGETSNIQIHIGGMGIDDTGKVTVTNIRSNENFTMSQKTGENFRNTTVALGDELVFTRRGFRSLRVKFKYSIPERINIAPIKGKKTDEQYIEY